MDIVVKSRHTECGTAFQQFATEKLARVERLGGRVQRIDVEVAKEHNPRLSDSCWRVQLTCRNPGPVIRAEHASSDVHVALDHALLKLEARLRRAADRRRVHHGTRTPDALRQRVPDARPADALLPADLPASAALAATEPAEPTAPAAQLHEPAVVPPSATDDETTSDGGDRIVDHGGVLMREKVHEAAPMTVDDALLEMELVGHDFFLFADSDSGLPSVVYRRRGYDYGVIRLRS